MAMTEGKWRLSAILFIMVMITLIYGVQAFFVGVSQEMQLGSTGEWEVNVTDDQQVRTDTSNIGTDIMGFFSGIWEGFTFQAIDEMPSWASFILTIFSTSLIITGAYIVYTFIYEVIKGLPFT